MKVRKYRYLSVIQGNYGQGWEDLSEYDRHEQGFLQLLRHDLKEYRLCDSYPKRVIRRRELI